MGLFNREGHRTGEGLDALTAGSLNELQRLEVSEHLSFCDLCLEAYMQRLEDSPLLTPEKPVKAAVMRRLWTRRAVSGLRKAGMVAAAACIAVGLWQGSNYAISRQHRAEPQTAACCVLPEAPPPRAASQGVAASLGRGLKSLTEGAHRYLDGLFSFDRQEDDGENTASRQPLRRQKSGDN